MGIEEDDSEDPWFQNYQNQGHGEYVQNVISAANFLEKQGIEDPEKIKDALENAKAEMV